jgi:FlaA1/EpsC-like NDP-sugar epimerase
MAWIGEYGRRVPRLRTVFFTAGIGFLVFFSLSYFMRERAYSRIVFAATAAASVLLMTAWRWLGNHGGKLFRRILGGTKRVAILGTGPRAQALAAMIQGESAEGYECIGFIHFPPESVPAEVRSGVIGDLNALRSLARKLDLQAVIIALEEGAYPAALQVLARMGSRALEIHMLVGDPAPGNITLVDLHFGG